jgi:hypothetical protein
MLLQRADRGAEVEQIVRMKQSAKIIIQIGCQRTTLQPSLLFFELRDLSQRWSSIVFVTTNFMQGQEHDHEVLQHALK